MDKQPRSFDEIARKAVKDFISETDDSVVDSELRAAIMQEARNFGTEES